MRNRPPLPRARPLASGFIALVSLTYGLIVLGALVRANDAGLACPDWPLCFGELIPRFDVRIAFEWGHRAIAGSVAIGFALLAWQTLRVPELRARSRRPLVLAAVLLIVQIVLGGLTVLQLLAAWTVTSHLLTGNAFAATLLWITLDLRAASRGDASPPPAPGALRALLLATAAILLLQMLLGGLVASRYAGLACTTWPACGPEGWFPSFEGAVGLHLFHRWNAALLLVALVASWRVAATSGALHGLAGLAAGLGVAQFGVGIANVVLALPVEVTGLHSALAAALVLCWTATLRAAGVLAPRDAATADGVLEPAR